MSLVVQLILLDSLSHSFLALISSFLKCSTAFFYTLLLIFKMPYIFVICADFGFLYFVLYICSMHVSICLDFYLGMVITMMLACYSFLLILFPNPHCRQLSVG